MASRDRFKRADQRSTSQHKKDSEVGNKVGTEHGRMRSWNLIKYKERSAVNRIYVCFTVCTHVRPVTGLG